jgi:hypothetical protein
VYIFWFLEQLNLFRRLYVCDWEIHSKNSVRRSILEFAIVPNRSEFYKRGMAPKRRK